ncbi:Protein of unknown function [Bacillus cytotoxicus]|uniref:Uncharacterized protein n=1 Tax=Bacillus cytotoxicus TaxID=580165 RepID=A0AAX2CGB5_9BACI|nr:Protein of unknown function [Bacillus cytotoxicus]SCN35149.1 Protein of unknown function [Bacillus cytotoxicus]
MQILLIGTGNQKQIFDMYMRDEQTLN